jgi:hypothetical protein
MPEGIPRGARMIRWNHFPFGRPVKLRPEMDHTIGETCGSISKNKGYSRSHGLRNPKEKKNRLANVSIAMIPRMSPTETENGGPGSAKT